MLIVISIISVLLGLLYGALERAQKFSRRAIAYTELKNIETAFKQYEAHYHFWPTNALNIIKSGEDQGFIIDKAFAQVLQGVSKDYEALMNEVNPAGIPFMEFARYNRDSGHPVNPFKSLSSNSDDTTRAYRVMFDSNGDNQIEVPGDDPAVPNDTASEIVFKSVAVWTYIPGPRTTDSSGNKNAVTDVMLGSWSPFATK